MTKKQNKKPKKQEKKLWIDELLDADLEGRATTQDIRALFAFDSTLSDEDVLFNFRLWSRHFFPQYFHAKDAPFHREIDKRNLAVYRGKEQVFVNIAFRGAAKTTRTKLFIAYCIANDVEHSRRYFKFLSADYANARQNVTDVYNMLISLRHYTDIFRKTTEKRAERMGDFTTATGVKVTSDAVRTDQRGDVQEDARPDFIFFDDFETRKILRSAVTLEDIWDNMDEAFNGMSRNGGAVYSCNYISERGNVHKLVQKYPSLLTPIKGSVENGVHIDGPPNWDAYTPEDVENTLRNADDPAGEYLCTPAAGDDIFFDRSLVDKQPSKKPIREVAGFKMFHEYDPSHRYGSGHDVGGGVGLDHSTSVFIDFSTTPSKVVATYKSNTIKPDTFGDEIKREAEYYGEPIVAVENNKFDMCIGRLKQIYDNLYTKEGKARKIGIVAPSEYGWNTNADTKPKMLFALKKAVEDGHLELSDPDLILEARSYSRDDLMDRDIDPRLSTRHFDLLFACAIAYQMKDHAEPAQNIERQYEILNTRQERKDIRADAGL